VVGARKGLQIVGRLAFIAIMPQREIRRILNLCGNFYFPPYEDKASVAAAAASVAAGAP
jgi:hypothetical protein